MIGFKTAHRVVVATVDFGTVLVEKLAAGEFDRQGNRRA